MHFQKALGFLAQYLVGKDRRQTSIKSDNKIVSFLDCNLEKAIGRISVSLPYIPQHRYIIAVYQQIQIGRNDCLHLRLSKPIISVMNLLPQFRDC